MKCDKIILEQFELLVSLTKVDKSALEADLLREVRSRVEREFMLQRQLVGFFLLQGLAALGRWPKRNFNVLASTQIFGSSREAALIVLSASSLITMYII